MSKTIIVAGFGPGISNAVAERFGREGFAVAAVARNAERLGAGVKALEGKGVKATAFPADLSDAAAVRAVVKKVQAALGPVTALHWNAYAGAAGDLLTASPAEVHAAIDIAVTNLVAAVTEALPDLKKNAGSSAVLVTNGGFGKSDPNVDAFAVSSNAMGLALGNAAKHKLVGMLAQKLKADGVYVGEVMVNGMVKGTAWDTGQATLEPSAIADKFFDLYRAREATFAEAG